MTRLKYIVLMVFSLGIAHFAQAQFTLSGEFRPRTELSHGYKSLASENQDASTITAQRTRLNAGYSNEFIKTSLVLQDVRRWGNQAQLVSNEDYAVSVHQAWAEILFSKEFSLKAGRQELVYDDSRIFGNVGWAHQARSHDIAVFKYEKDLKLHFGIAHHENGDITNSDYNGPDAYKDLQFIWFNNSWEKAALSLLFLNNGVPAMEDGEQKNKFSQTMGGHVKGRIKTIQLVSNLYYQTGKHVSGASISAFNFLAEASLATFTLGFEHLSGSAYDDTDYKSFTPLYGTNHKFNGFMDYFYVGNHIGSVGLNDLYLKYNYSKNKLAFDAHLHYFGAAAEIAANADKYLGTEIDLALGWTVNPMAKISFGLSGMFAGESMELLKGGDSSASQYWGYVMLAINPTFIK
ncbi:alginate export family protein [uncultured Draconibacterium sp.]|uniref:alginate export family protein n=1 Tax=uncultured Draconibacterium sp. TaxID=1573823 RepID=UPI0025E83BB8|nr:alginate export family protein [uncultured Draconibacterium sp.]